MQNVKWWPQRTNSCLGTHRPESIRKYNRIIHRNPFFDPCHLDRIWLVWIRFLIHVTWTGSNSPVLPPPQSSAAAPPALAAASWTRQWSPDPVPAPAGTPSGPGFWTGHQTGGLPSAGSHWTRISTQLIKFQLKFIYRNMYFYNLCFYQKVLGNLLDYNSSEGVFKCLHVSNPMSWCTGGVELHNTSKWYQYSFFLHNLMLMRIKKKITIHKYYQSWIMNCTSICMKYYPKFIKPT